MAIQLLPVYDIKIINILIISASTLQHFELAAIMVSGKWDISWHLKFSPPVVNEEMKPQALSACKVHCTRNVIFKVLNLCILSSLYITVYWYCFNHAHISVCRSNHMLNTANAMAFTWLFIFNTHW